MRAPVFVKIEKYGEVEDTIKQIKAKLEEAKEVLEKLDSIRSEEEKEITTWEQDIKNMEEKLAAVEHSMAQ